MAVRPIPTPVSNPQKRKNSQTVRVNNVPSKPARMIDSAMVTIRRTPNRFISVAVKGPSSPNNARRLPNAEETSEAFQPNSCCRGKSRIPEIPSVPAVITEVAKVTATTIHA
jgi:hypothetical protein